MRRLLIWILWIVGLIILVAGIGYLLYPDFFLTQGGGTLQEADGETLSTTDARVGDLILTASGIGELMASNPVNLHFSAGGTVRQLSANVGDKVAAGDVLAELDDAAVRLQVVQAAIDLRQAELQLEAVEAPATTAEIAAAQAAVAAAQAEHEALTAPPSAQELAVVRFQLTGAEQALNALLAGFSADEAITLQADLRTAEITVRQAQRAYDEIAWQGNSGASSQAAELQQATIAHEKALAQFNLAAVGASAEELSSARAAVAQAQTNLNDLIAGPDPLEIAAAEARLIEATAQLEDLLLGPDPVDLETAQLSLQRARHNLDTVMMDLKGSTITASADGVVTAVNAQHGEQVGVETIITLASADRAELLFWIDELDIDSAKAGNPVSIIFEAAPDFVFDGVIRRIEPALVDVDGAPAVQGWAEVDVTQHPVNLLFGMTAEIEIIAGEVRKAVLVPVQALRELATGVYAVFVVLEDGELELRPVQVGLRDFINAEIVSGLTAGETVSTGSVATQ